MSKLYRMKTGYAHWCPACKKGHVFATDKPNSNGAIWTFNGNSEAPTFEPSMNIVTNAKDHPHYQPQAATSVCHYFLRAGILTYLMDCTHEMRGMKVSLPDHPAPR